MPAALLFGEVEEAAEYADVYGDIWRATPGAMEWLRQAERSGKKPRHGKSGGHLPGRQRLH
jgi:hypothetical protein